WAVHAVKTFTPTLVNELTLGLGRNNLRRLWADAVDTAQLERSPTTIDPPTLRPFPRGGVLPISGLPKYLPYFPNATFSGGSFPNSGYVYTGNPGNGGSPPYMNFNYTYSLQDDLSKAFGSHNL